MKDFMYSLLNNFFYSSIDIIVIAILGVLSWKLITYITSRYRIKKLDRNNLKCSFNYDGNIIKFDLVGYDGECYHFLFDIDSFKPGLRKEDFSRYIILMNKRDVHIVDIFKITTTSKALELKRNNKTKLNIIRILNNTGKIN